MKSPNEWCLPCHCICWGVNGIIEVKELILFGLKTISIIFPEQLFRSVSRSHSLVSACLQSTAITLAECHVQGCYFFLIESSVGYFINKELLCNKSIHRFFLGLFLFC